MINVKKDLPSMFRRFYDNKMHEINIKPINIKFNIMKDTFVWFGGEYFGSFRLQLRKKMECRYKV